MDTFKDWLQKVEAGISAETSTSTADVAGNPYGAGITYTDPKRDVFGTLRKCKDDKTGKCGLGTGLGGGVQDMQFSKKK